MSKTMSCEPRVVADTPVSPAERDALVDGMLALARKHRVSIMATVRARGVDGERLTAGGVVVGIEGPGGGVVQAVWTT